MTRKPSEPLTELIDAARRGGHAEQEELFRAIYDELREMARRIPNVGRDGDTVQATVLAHETFLQFQRRFPAPPSLIPESRATFFRTVALAMRTILRDHWRAKTAAKRGGKSRPGSLPEEAILPGRDDPEAAAFIALDDALRRLEAHDERWYDIAMQRFFIGRSIKETADTLGLARSTVAADWKEARRWLRREIAGDDAEASSMDTEFPGDSSSSV